jgi:hypothetical protein
MRHQAGAVFAALMLASSARRGQQHESRPAGSPVLQVIPAHRQPPRRALIHCAASFQSQVKIHR